MKAVCMNSTFFASKFTYNLASGLHGLFNVCLLFLIFGIHEDPMRMLNPLGAQVPWHSM